MTEKLSRDELAAFREMAASFAKKTLAPMLAHESPDGRLDLLPEILGQARVVGLLASARPDAPGRETGIWGSQTLAHGPQVSTLLLEELATVCGGAAMCLHAQGLAALLLLRAEKIPGNPPEAVAAAFAESFALPGLATLREPGREAPAAIATTAREAAGGYELSGEKTFVYTCGRPEAFLVFGRDAGGWACFLVPNDASGLVVSDAGARTGLRAAGLLHLKLDRVKLEEDRRLRFSAPAGEVALDHLRCNLLGLSAISVGVARGALASAKIYAAERYQGGDQIIRHPAVRMLLADSDARIAAGRAQVESAAGAEGSAEARLREAARAKLMVTAAAAQAVTDCLQVFGGYGYMEDYRIEKRLRDVSVLKSAGGSPRELRALLADWIEEG